MKALFQSLLTGLVIPWMRVSPFVGFALLLLVNRGWFALVCIWLIAWFFLLTAKATGQLASNTDASGRTLVADRPSGHSIRCAPDTNVLSLFATQHMRTP